MNPVVVVRGPDGERARGTVLVAVRDEDDLACARYAAREAGLHGAALRVLHVWNVLRSAGSMVSMLDGVDEIAGEHAETLKAVTDTIREEFPDLAVEARAEAGGSVAGVLVEASGHADLLVMGGRRAPGPLGLGPNLGRATHSVLHHALCPVLFLPRPAGPGTP
ncbi:universal stress protein [Streptomyces lavendulae]|uniref:universal stress protein n=1 Tax=Streptomyces lavendulae TaxID=1914 RepID=UPI003684C519